MAENIWVVRTAVVMPDHLHLLVVLGDRVELGGALRRFKGGLSPTLRAVGLKWERGYFDHRMRADEDRLPVFSYVFLNPYRAKLLSEDQTWAGYFCSTDDWEWFGPLTNDECPFPEWLE